MQSLHLPHPHGPPVALYAQQYQGSLGEKLSVVNGVCYSLAPLPRKKKTLGSWLDSPERIASPSESLGFHPYCFATPHIASHKSTEFRCFNIASKISFSCHFVLRTPDSPQGFFIVFYYFPLKCDDDFLSENILLFRNNRKILYFCTNSKKTLLHGPFARRGLQPVLEPRGVWTLEEA